MAGLPSQLHRAARVGDLRALAAALSHGASANEPTAAGWTPLHDASWGGHEGTVGALLAAGATVDTVTVDGLSPLTLAAGEGHKAVVDLLLSGEAYVDSQSTDGRTPLESALQRGHLAVARQLVDSGAAVSEACCSLWLRALVALDGKRCRLLDEREPGTRLWVWALDGPLRLDRDDAHRLGEHISTLIHDGALVRQVDLRFGVRFAVDARAFQPSDTGHTLPSGRWRFRRGWTERVQAILHGEANADGLDEDGRLAAYEALRAGEAGALAALLQSGADPEALPPQGCMRGAALLMNAAHLGHPGCVEVLLAAGAGVDLQTPSGWTPLMAAAARGHVEALGVLVRADADLSLRNDQGQTALAVAQARGQSEAARVLLVAKNAHHLARVAAGEVETPVKPSPDG